MKHLISYDLRDRGREAASDYRKMKAFLESTWEAEMVLKSKWVTDTEDSHKEILDEIKRQDFFRESDGILVCALIEFGGGFASYSSSGLPPTYFDIR